MFHHGALEWGIEILRNSTTLHLYILLCICFTTASNADGMASALVSYTVTEDSEVPITLGDVLSSLRSSTFVHATVADVVIFPSWQPFSEYFQLVYRRRTEPNRSQALAYAKLQLVKPLDLEKACKKRLPLPNCFQTSQICCCDIQRLFCTIYLQVAAATEGGLFNSLVHQSSLKVFLVEIKIVDRNDHAPVFTPSHFTMEVSEGTKNDELYSLPVARDGDLGQNAELSYTIAAVYKKSPQSNKWRQIAEGEEVFSLKASPLSLTLVINGNLDREEIDGYKVMIMASDMAENTAMRQTGTLTVTVIITDVNDISPAFSSQNLTLEVKENSAIGTVVYTVEAHDGDTGKNGQISYAISTKQKDLPFRIDLNTGYLIVNGSLDREQKEEYRFSVEAFDYGTPARSSTLSVTIRVLDENDNAPTILLMNTLDTDKSALPTPHQEKFLLRVSEAAPIGSLIANFSVTDRDEGGNEMTSCHLIHETFELRRNSNNSYSLYLSRPIDYEIKRMYCLNIVCEDSGYPHALTSEAEVKVLVLDENDNYPIFQHPKMIPPAWLVNDTQMYQFSALLSTNKSDDLQEVNDGFVVFLPKSFPVGDVFMRFQATDHDGDDDDANKVHFSLRIFKEQHDRPGLPSVTANSSNQTGIFSLSGCTGELVLISSPNHEETITIYKGEIIAQDKAPNPLLARKKLTIIHAESNSNAPVVRIFNFALANSLSPYQILDQESISGSQGILFYIPLQNRSPNMIGQVVGSDDDSGQAGHVMYNLASHQPECFRVSINNLTGLLTFVALTESLSDRCKLQAQLDVTDNGFPKRQTLMNITFQIFDAGMLDMEILVNQSVVLSKQEDQNKNSWYFEVHLPQIGQPLFQMFVTVRPGLIEPKFEARICHEKPEEGFSTTSNVVEVDENTGHVYMSESFSVMDSRKSIFITVSNRLWPALPPKIYRAVIGVRGNETVEMRIGRAAQLECNFTELGKFELEMPQQHLTVFLVSIWTFASMLCLIIIALVSMVRTKGAKRFLPMTRLLQNKKSRPRLYDLARGHRNSIYSNEASIEIYGQGDSCIPHSTTPIFQTVINNCPVLSLQPTHQQGPKHDNKGDASTKAQLRRLRHPSALPSTVSSPGRNLAGTELTPKVLMGRSARPVIVISDTRKALGVVDVLKEQKVSRMTGAASVNIIVHNNFDKSEPVR
ncbi:unnamed protein product [Mesocestoides corti]|uniref:Cadherin domain-containing protein n=1 Tax=Mesocestoides corti TaxID=53468 RepID=A0A0R3U4I8_MESCO|nr:unnamed protein product [Mesocestoides corti]